MLLLLSGSHPNDFQKNACGLCCVLRKKLNNIASIGCLLFIADKELSLHPIRNGGNSNKVVMDVKSQYLSFDFTYDGKKHKGKVRLTESDPNVFMLYDDHDLEITWMKRIRHKGKHIVINIVVKDDWNNGWNCSFTQTAT